MIKPSMSLPSPTFCVESLVSPPHTRASKTRVEGRIPNNNDSMNSLSFVAVVLLSLVLGIANGFVVPSPSSLNVRQHVGGGGMSMIFGGGAKKAAKGGLVVKVQQKTGFKETEITLAGKTNLRKALLDNKIDVYPLQGKIYNCGGGGSCGTCAVNVVAGAGNCSTKGPGEKKLLDKKPASYRLSCCTMVTGPITIKTKP